MDTLKLPEVKNRKGLSLYVGIDSEYCGFGVSLKKRVKTLRLGYIIIRFINTSEAQYNRIITIATLSESNDISVIKE